MSDKKLLTPLELKVMNLLWRKKQALVKDLIEEWPDNPAPAYNTVSTMVRILKEKGFVGHRSQGRSHEYFPIVTRAKYQKWHISSVLNHVFAGSKQGLISTLLDEEQLNEQELDALKSLIDQNTDS